MTLWGRIVRCLAQLLPSGPMESRAPYSDLYSNRTPSGQTAVTAPEMCRYAARRSRCPTECPAWWPLRGPIARPCLMPAPSPYSEPLREPCAGQLRSGVSGAQRTRHNANSAAGVGCDHSLPRCLPSGRASRTSRPEPGQCWSADWRHPQSTPGPSAERGAEDRPGTGRLTLWPVASRTEANRHWNSAPWQTFP